MIDGLFMFLTLCVFFVFVCFSSDVNDVFIQHFFFFFGEPRDEVICRSSL